MLLDSWKVFEQKKGDNTSITNILKKMYKKIKKK